MLREQIIATNDVDLQNQRITDEALYEMADGISLSTSATKIGVDHDATMLPMGKVLHGKVVESEKGSLELRAVLDDFSEEYIQFFGPDNEKLYFGYSRNDTRPFVDSVIDTDKDIAIGLNPIDFTDEGLCDICEYIAEAEIGDVFTLAKKAEIPDIEIVITVAKYAFYYWLLKKTVDKTTDKLADKFADDAVSLYEYIKGLAKKVFSGIKADQRVTYVINAIEQPIEMVIQCDKAEILARAMDKVDDGYIMETYQKFKQHLNDGIHKMQFLYDATSEKWELNYILSKQGQVIGTEKCYEKSVKLYRRLMNTPGAGFSLGATVDYEVEEMPDA